jgi:hypothetical protein
MRKAPKKTKNKLFLVAGPEACRFARCWEYYIFLHLAVILSASCSGLVSLPLYPRAIHFILFYQSLSQPRKHFGSGMMG